MSQEVVQQLLSGALKAIRNGEKDLARRAYMRVLKMEPDNETAYIGLATTAQNRAEQVLVLKKLLEVKPDSRKARAALAQLGLSTDALRETSQPAQPPPAATTSASSADDWGDDWGGEDWSSQEPDAPVAEVDDFEDAPTTIPDDPQDAWDDDNWDDAVVVDAVIDAYDADVYDDDDEAELKPEPSSAEAAGGAGLYDALFDEDVDEFADTKPPQPVEEADDFALPDEALIEEGHVLDDIVAVPRTTDELPAVEVPAEPVITLEPLDLTEDFSQAVIQLPGRDGIPVISAEVAERASAEAEQIVQQRLMADQPVSAVEWETKTGRRSGENDWLLFRAQIAGGIVAGVALVGLISLLLLNAPGAPLYVIRASYFTQTPTPTATATPGITHTPSPTPETTLTPEPTLPSNFPLADPTIAPPPTEIYLPPGISVIREVQDALPLIEEGRVDEAISLLDRAQQVTSATGNFLPYYYLSVAMLADDRPDDAREVIEDGEEAWQERGFNVNARPLINVAHARVDLYEARQSGGNADLLASAEDRLQDVITGADGDGRFVDAYLLLAERHLISGDEQEALRVLDQAYRDTLRGDLLGDSRIRLMRANIYAEQERYDRALFELETLLRANNYVEEAHQRRIEIAMDAGRPGLAVKYAEAYAFYFPGEVQPYLMWGDAHMAEGKVDWALQYYSRGLQGDESDPAYLEALLKRAAISVEQGDYDLAFADYDEALSISDNDPNVRLQRMVAAYTSGNIEVAESDFETLNDNNVDLSGESLLIQGRILLDTGADPDAALNLIERAVNVEGISGELRPIADEYRARAFLELERYDDALAAIQRLENVETNMQLRALRGRIYEALGRRDGDQEELEAALEDFEFVISWQQVLPASDIDFEAIRESYDTLVSQLR